ncbi:GH18865 [Drosophila grimshawi]|uniref:GH18865 n=1 Tax=Drosophila grimshawi TaxID=7222 RepID=B4JGE8_DROGR|nr:GH18865 [Drosophila grimshawi]
MAFTVEVSASQNRAKSESDNSNHHNNHNTENISYGQLSNTDYFNGINSSSNQTECRKSQRYNIDDPGASTGTGNNIRGTAEQRRNYWRENLLVQLQLLAEENKANSAYDGFAYVDVNDENDNHTDRNKHATQSKNYIDQGAHAEQQQHRQQQERQDRAERASNSSYQNTLFTRNDPTTTSTTVTQTVQVSSTPQTLASMAGIQLTGADMQSPQDMSGAMPTATVEEIDVPVFIDEYLQNIEASLSTSSNNKSEEIGTEILTETDKFDFDFDINLIAEDLIECKEMDQCNLGMDRNNSDYYNCDLINMDTTDFQQFEDGEELALDMNSMCKGIDINSNLREDFSLENILTNSENPMLANFSQGSISNSQVTKEFTELPMLANENSMENSSYGFSQPLFGSGHLDGVNEDVCHLVAMPDGMPTLGVKRTASAATISVAESMPQKRIKLGLNINKSQISHSDVINTPTIIEQMLNFDELNFANTTSTRDEIYEDLRNTEDISSITILPDYCTAPNTPNSTYSVGIARSPEPTCQLGFGGFITAPVSPAFSTASTSQFSVTTSTTDKSKRKRGRPAKEHADGPDPELMSRMTHEEAKLYLDRLKNNEASRVSRKKTKKREEEEVKDEDALIAKNHELREQLQRLKHRSQKIVDFLNQNHHKRSTYIKPEPGH